MRRFRTASMIVLAAIAVTHAPLLQAQPSVELDRQLIQVLIITGKNVHPWRETTPVMKQTLEDAGNFEVWVTEEFRGATADRLLNPHGVRQPARSGMMFRHLH